MAQKVKSYAIIALGSLMYALAFDWLISPNQIAMGGVTGLAQTINALVPVLPVGVLTIVINVPLFLVGWRKLGGHLLVSSLFAMTLSSLAIDAIAAGWRFQPMDPLLACLCGGAAMGVAFGMVFSQGATTGGTDIVARLLKLRWPWLPMGKLVLVPDGVVLVLAALVFGQAETALYGAVTLVVMGRVMDMVLYGLDVSRVALIISDRWERITQVLLREQDRGVTILRGRGAYTGTDKHVLLVAFPQREIVQLKRTVRDLDPGAFLIVWDAHEILGEGFGDYHKEEI